MLQQHVFGLCFRLLLSCDLPRVSILIDPKRQAPCCVLCHFHYPRTRALETPTDVSVLSARSRPSALVRSLVSIPHGYTHTHATPTRSTPPAPLPHGTASVRLALRPTSLPVTTRLAAR